MENKIKDGVSSAKGMPLWFKILIGMVAGVIVGAVFGESSELIKPIGTLFISAIKMLIVPLIFCSLVVGVTSMKDTTKMGRIGLKSIVFYLTTTAVAISIGLGLGIFFEPGAALNMVASTTNEVKASPSLVDTLVGLIPKNPIGALAAGNILQIIVFALGLGIALNLVGEKSEPVVKFFEGLAEAMYKMTELVMKFAPYGVFALMAWVSGKYGLELLLPLIKVIGLVYLGCILHVLFLGGGLVGLFGKLNPKRFYKGIIEAQVIAFTTTSSSGTLPASIKCATENLGVSRSISSFVLPMGATINMDGTALYQGVLALFIAQAFGVDLSTADYLTIIATATLASIGTAGVPGAGLIMLSLVLSTVGLPLEGIAIVAGIDRILDMARTTVNVTGDLMVTLLIGKSEGELDLERFNNKQTNAPIND
ncbi:dicarboxylate/amino acid:cation symporter [Psychromonas arctica]|uniref:dicarboxylate/amino acid:cation symporter n=1 Tax=Psychromonas arctica TaxID=168275 RepID=UPI002FD6CBF0